MPTQMYREGAAKISRKEFVTVLKFVDALLPGMLYVKCGECQRFKQVITPQVKMIPHPTKIRERIQIQVCEECK